jgi:hypothetical protein
VRRLCGGLEGGANGAELDVREDDSRIGRVLLHISRLAGGGSASTTGSTQLRRVSVSGVGGVEPEHVDSIVVPQTHDEDVAARKRSSHSVEAAESLERGGVAEDRLLRVAERLGDGVALDAGDGRIAVGICLAVLDVESLDLREGGAGANELGDNGHLLLGVELHAGAVEVLHTHAVALNMELVF